MPIGTDADVFPAAAADIVLEERLEGREVSVFALCDGRAIVPFGAACDYKRAGDGDTGPNTGGMGAYSPPAGFPDDLDDRVRERILEPLLRGLLAEGEEYIGVLYCGLMWTADGPFVIEFNARFGDPETQALATAHWRRFRAAARLGGARCDGPFAGDASRQHCSRRRSGNQRVSAEQYGAGGLTAEVALGEGCRVFWGASKRMTGR